jgi:hypothetical protein
MPFDRAQKTLQGPKGIGDWGIRNVGDEGERWSLKTLGGRGGGDKRRVKGDCIEDGGMECTVQDEGEGSKEEAHYLLQRKFNILRAGRPPSSIYEWDV